MKILVQIPGETCWRCGTCRRRTRFANMDPYHDDEPRGGSICDAADSDSEEITR